MSEKYMDNHKIQIEQEFYEAVGNNIRKARKNASLSQNILADMIGISRVSMVNIESGKQRLPLHKVSLICNILDITLEEVTSVLDFHFSNNLPENIKQYRKEIISSGLTKDQLTGAELVFIGLSNILTTTPSK